jgi:hypothetical protein
MRGRKQDRSARVVIAGHGFVHNRRGGHDELAVVEPVVRRLAVAFDELALAICRPIVSRRHHAANSTDATAPGGQA